MPITVRQLHPLFVGEVSGIDLRQPLDRAAVAEVEAAINQHGVLVFHDQVITDEQQQAFSRNFGGLESTVRAYRTDFVPRLDVYMADISNLDENNKVLSGHDRRRLNALGNRLWHSDSSFKRVPSRFSLLSARVVPSWGGETQFADMRAAYDTLDEDTKRQVHDLICEHSQMYSRSLLGFTEFTEEEKRLCVPVQQRLVRRHQVTGRLSLYLASHAGTIIGWPIPEARAFLMDLVEHATQRKFVYAHVWKLHDLVIWDNRVTMHRARRYDSTQVRDMRRTTVTNEVSSLEQAPLPLS